MKFSLAFIILITCIQLQAQSKHISKKSHYIYHSHGISFQKYTNLKARITSNPKYEHIPTSMGTLQLGFITVANKLSFTTGATVGNSLSGNKKTRSTACKMLGASIDVGYNLYAKDRLAITPFIGLEVENHTVQFNKDNSTIAFDSILSNTNIAQSVMPVIFYNTFFNYRTGITLSYKSIQNKRSSVGLQVGYSGSFAVTDWKINTTQTLATSPKDGLYKAFANVIFRYQFFSKKKQSPANTAGLGMAIN